MIPLIALACAPEPYVLAITHLEEGEVRTYDADSGQTLAAWALPDGDAWQPAALLPTPAGLAVSDFLRGDLLLLSDEGAVRRLHDNDGALPPLRLEEPCAMAASGEDLLVLGNDSRNLLRLGPDGVTTALTEDLRAGHGLSVAPDGTVWVGTSPVRRGLGMVQQLDPRTGARLADFALPGELMEATAILAEDGAVLVADWFAGEVASWDPRTGRREATVAAGLDGPISLRRAPDDGLLILDRSGVVHVKDGETRRVLDLNGERWTRDLTILDPTTD